MRGFLGRLWRLFARLPVGARRRLLGLLVALPSVVILATAFGLDPDPSGVGTHTQLGMGGCSLLEATSWPCPMCGMTTTFAYLAHGQVWAGVVNQPFGVVLFALTLGMAVVGTYDLIWARGRLGEVAAWVYHREFPVAVACLLGLLGGWAYKVIQMGGHLSQGG